MAQAIADFRGVLNDSLSRVELTLQDLSEDLVDIVRVSTFDRDIECFLILLDLEVERNLLDDLLFVNDQIVTELFLTWVLSQFC